jgi:alpha-beta hydrolase superfamily lysophospholipase
MQSALKIVSNVEAAPETSEETFKGAGGLAIFTRRWRPAGKPRGVVVIAHGFNSHSGRYVDVAGRFVDASLAVYALDHRGRGRSEGERFHVENFSDYVDDLATFIKRVKTREPGLPVFLLGHSAGGVISSLYALDHPSEIAGLISESFAFELPAPKFALAALKGLSRIAPHLRVLRLKNEDFSRDPWVVESMNRDPLIAGENETAKTVAELIRADERLRVEFPRIKLPLLILHGTKDKAAKVEGSRLFKETAGSGDKTLKLYDGAYHDLLNDIGREKVVSDIVDWIQARLAGR